jgi:Tol biopolymer transport system component
VMELDGSGSRDLLAPLPSRGDFSPVWTRDGTHVIATDFSSTGGGGLYLVDAVTGTAARVTPRDLTRGLEHMGRYAPDEAWVYFRVDNRALIYTELWRARADGSQASRVGPVLPAPSAEGGLWYSGLSVAPDGRSLVVSIASDELSQRLYRLDVATGQLASLGINGKAPVFSPSGRWIAFLQDGRLAVADADLRNVRILASGRYDGNATWSPDERWIVVQRFGWFPEMLDVQTGERLPLNFPYAEQLAWRP